MDHHQGEEVEEPDSYYSNQAARMTNLHLWRT